MTRKNIADPRTWGVGREGRGCWVHGAPWIQGEGPPIRGGRPGLGDPQSCHLCRLPECPSRSPRAAFASLSLPFAQGRSSGPRNWRSVSKTQSEAGKTMPSDSGCSAPSMEPNLGLKAEHFDTFQPASASWSWRDLRKEARGCLKNPGEDRPFLSCESSDPYLFFTPTSSGARV